jgi:hypothetical protein
MRLMSYGTAAIGFNTSVMVSLFSMWIGKIEQDDVRPIIIPNTATVDGMSVV